VGFKLPSTVFVLDFDGTDLDGLTVKARSVPFGTFLELQELADVADKSGAEAIAAMRKLVEQFAGTALKSWDLEDDNGPVPATVDGLGTLEARHVLTIIGTWLRAAGGEAPAPLGEPSPGIAPSAVSSLPMVELSTSQAS
jgi:hypothetical protein